MGIFLSILLIYVISSIIIAAPIWFFGRHRVHWFYWEFFDLSIPFLIWVILVLTNLKSKSLSNAGVEALILGILAGVIQIFPLIMPEIFGSRFKSAFTTLLISIIVTLLIYFFMPTLPE